MDGYTIHSQHSNSSVGGVAYILEGLNALENELRQNVLCCRAYRHPNTEVEKFNNYIDKVMQKKKI